MNPRSLVVGQSSGHPGIGTRTSAQEGPWHKESHKLSIYTSPPIKGCGEIYQVIGYRFSEDEVHEVGEVDEADKMTETQLRF